MPRKNAVALYVGVVLVAGVAVAAKFGFGQMAHLLGTVVLLGNG